ncbi:MAG: protein kinase [Nannocystis sp.]|nr:protein kinase [Nannocystis sp.]
MTTMTPNQPAAPAEDAEATRVGADDVNSQLSHPIADGRACAQPGEVLADRYRIVDRLGRGGMGEVYLATHVAIGRQVAIKILRADAQENPEMARRFLQEARTSSQLRHPNIVDITDFGHNDRGAPFFVMELLEGEDLKSLVKRERTLPWPRVVAIATQICAALTAAHASGVVHRDMKPDNVYLLRHGDYEHVKVLDFGIAKVLSGQEAGEATRTGVLLGTPHYMSPEQASDDPLDSRSDIYAMGVLLYRMVAGQLPFRGPSFMKVLGQQIHEPPPPPSLFAPPDTLSDEAEAIILKCLAKRREDRFQSADELAAALLASMGLVADGTTGSFSAPRGIRSAASLSAPAAASSAPAAASSAASRLGASAHDTLATASAAPRPRSRALLLGLGAVLFAGGAVAMTLSGGPEDPPPRPLTAPALVPVAAAPSLEPPIPRDSRQEDPLPADPLPADPLPADPLPADPLPEPPPDPTPIKRDKPKKPVAERPAPKDSLSGADLTAAAASVRAALSRCAGGLPGMVIKVEVTVSPAGKVTSATAQKPQRGSALGKCVEEVAGGARFPALTSAQSVTIALRLP